MYLHYRLHQNLNALVPGYDSHRSEEGDMTHDSFFVSACEYQNASSPRRGNDPRKKCEGIGLVGIEVDQDYVGGLVRSARLLRGDARRTREHHARLIRD